MPPSKAAAGALAFDSASKIGPVNDVNEETHSIDVYCFVSCHDRLKICSFNFLIS